MARKRFIYQGGLMAALNEISCFQFISTLLNDLSPTQHKGQSTDWREKQ